jgi:hypothetical protein
MSNRNTVVGIAGDATIYGPLCAQALYGPDALTNADLNDREGNPLRAVFDDSEQCGTCGKPVCECEGPLVSML